MNSPLRILVVDDNGNFQDRFRQILLPICSDTHLQDRDTRLDESKEIAAVCPYTFDITSSALGDGGLNKVVHSLADASPYALVVVNLDQAQCRRGWHTLEKILQLDSQIQAIVCTPSCKYVWNHMVQRLGLCDRVLILQTSFGDQEALQMVAVLTQKYIMERAAKLKQQESKLPDQAPSRTVEQANRERREALKLLAETQKNVVHLQKSRLLGTLTGCIVHDFANLLQVVTNYIALAKSHSGKNAMLSDILESASDAAEKARQVSRKILDIGRTNSQRTMVDVSNAIQLSERLIRPLLTPNHRLIVHSHNNAPKYIQAEPAILEQILLNLCTNARDAMPLGGVVTVETNAKHLNDITARERNVEPGMFLTVSVQDEGHGMDEETQSNVFDAFYTTKSEGKGSGLGLHMVSNLVHRHQGTIEIESQVDVGTTFRIWLPARPQGKSQDITPTIPVSETPYTSPSDFSFPSTF